MPLIFPQKMDKNKDGVVTMEEFIIACQKVRLNKHLHFHHLLYLAKHIRFWQTFADSLIHVFIFSLPRMKTWWDPCSCLKMWCRPSWNKGDEDMKKEKKRNQRAWSECVCMGAYVQYLQSLLPLPVLSKIRLWALDPTRISCSDWQDWRGTLSSPFPAEFLQTSNTKWSFWQPGCVDASVSAVSGKLTFLQIKMLLHHPAGSGWSQNRVQEAETFISLSFFFMSPKTRTACVWKRFFFALFAIKTWPYVWC